DEISETTAHFDIHFNRRYRDRVHAEAFGHLRALFVAHSFDGERFRHILRGVTDIVLRNRWPRLKALLARIVESCVLGVLLEIAAIENGPLELVVKALTQFRVHVGRMFGISRERFSELRAERLRFMREEIRVERRRFRLADREPDDSDALYVR